MLPSGTVIKTISGGTRKMEEWTGTITSGIPVSDGSIRYEVCPDQSFWAKGRLKPWETLRVYSYELYVINPDPSQPIE